MTARDQTTRPDIRLDTLYDQLAAVLTPYVMTRVWPAISEHVTATMAAGVDIGLRHAETRIADTIDYLDNVLRYVAREAHRRLTTQP